MQIAMHANLQNSKQWFGNKWEHLAIFLGSTSNVGGEFVT